MFNYNIHNLLKIKSNINIMIPHIFEVEDVADPDLEIHIGDFNLEEAVKRSKEAYYYEHRLGPFKSKFIISDISGKTMLFYKSLRYKFQREIRMSIISLIHTIISWKLLWKGYVQAFAACFDMDGEGFLVVAPPGGGKTSTTLSLVKDYGLNYLSDDTTIVNGEGVAYCYPMPMRITPYHLKSYAINLRFKRRVNMFFKLGLKKIPFIGSYVSNFCVDPHEVLDNLHLKRSTHVKQIFLLEKGEDGIEKIDSKFVMKRILNLTLWFHIVRSWSSIIPLIIYGYLNPNLYLGNLVAAGDKIIRGLVNRSKCFIVRSRSSNYGKIIMDEIGKA